MVATIPDSESCTVCFPREFLIVPLLFIGMSVLGFARALAGTGNWTVVKACAVALVGIGLLLRMAVYRTVLSMKGVEKRSWTGRISRYSYSDVRRVKIFRFRFMIVLLTTDGRKLKIYGPADQLADARDFLSKRIPEAFE
jgi:hypothetical protein